MVQRLSLGQMLLTHTRETLIGVGLVVTATVSIYITFTYLVTYSTQILKLPLNQTFLVQMVGAGLMVLLTPFMGAWSDRVGRRPIVIGSLIGYLLVLYPLYAWLTDAPSISRPDRAGGGVLLRVGLLRRVQHGHGRVVPGTRALGRPVAGL